MKLADVAFRWADGNRARVFGILVVIIGWLNLIPGFPEEITTGLNTIAGILIGTVAVHAVVMPVKKVKRAVKEAATKAVTQLDEGGIGAVGALTDTAKDVVEETTNEVLASVGVKSKS